jgi:sulfite exporter TauE/SafE
VGLVLGVIGLADVADTLPFDADLAVLIPLALIVAGTYLIFRDRLPARG